MALEDPLDLLVQMDVQEKMELGVLLDLKVPWVFEGTMVREALLVLKVHLVYKDQREIKALKVLKGAWDPEDTMALGAHLDHQGLLVLKEIQEIQGQGDFKDLRDHKDLLDPQDHGVQGTSVSVSTKQPQVVVQRQAAEHMQVYWLLNQP